MDISKSEQVCTDRDSAVQSMYGSGAGYVSLRLDSGRIELATPLLRKVRLEFSGDGLDLVLTYEGCFHARIFVTSTLAWGLVESEEG